MTAAAAAIGDWRELAECARGYNPEIWFPDTGAFAARSQAVAVCRGCPVRAACLADGLNDPFGTFGIRGGLTEWERERFHTNGLVPAEGTTRRLQALARLGWSSAEVEASLRRRGTAITAAHLRDLRRGLKLTVHSSTAVAVVGVYAAHQWRLSEGPQAWRVRNLAEANDWPAPDDWHGLDIDDPRVRPALAA